MAVAVNQNNFARAGDFADLGNVGVVREAAEAWRRFWRDGEKQAVVFAAVESESERIDSAREQGDRNANGEKLVCPDSRADAAGRAEASQISGKAVRNVHHGGGDALARKRLTEGDRNLRVEVRLEIFLQGGLARPAAKDDFEAKLRGAESAADVDKVAAPGAEARNGKTCG